MFKWFKKRYEVRPFMVKILKSLENRDGWVVERVWRYSQEGYCFTHKKCGLVVRYFDPWKRSDIDLHVQVCNSREFIALSRREEKKLMAFVNKVRKKIALDKKEKLAKEQRYAIESILECPYL